ncbi:MAG: type II toxin-antitoxin system RelE/ParE family toxin [Eggerthellaceae bacterium]|nr:type II toxin-antitoxin system RelE/ParE family toxin [Eggerthellaceae bacterium]
MTAELRSLRAVDRLVSAIDNMVSILECTPYIKAISEKPFLAERGLREYFVMNYVVVYRVGGSIVTLVNLFHQTQQYDSERYWED